MLQCFGEKLQHARVYLLRAMANALLALGTANLFAKHMGLTAIIHGRSDVELAWIDGRQYLNFSYGIC
jgi:hypothetical protein